jgi:hypothetical protein
MLMGASVTRPSPDRPQIMLTFVNPEQRLPADHPIQLTKLLAEMTSKELLPPLR